MGERQFGPYRLVQQVAVGGMAEIHLAKTGGIAGFEKYVALKMIHPNFSQDEQFIQMLIDEAKITVQLQHVNIAQTFDLGRVGDMFYITMEFVDGSDLYRILRRSAEHDRDMPFDIAAYIAKEVATGLDYAHRKRDHAGRPLGIVHRDVSPQNVLISHAGEVKLVDFGIAKATMRARQTAVGVIKGKYYYMSPEQAWGDNVDHRTDIFSAGILLYEMITGQMLYLEEDINKLLGLVRRADIDPPSALRAGIPPQLERIVMHALQKAADDRYRTAADLAADLERFLHVYSPVFTASKLARYVGSVLDLEEVQPKTPLPPPPDALRSARRATQRVQESELVRSRDEFTDENSVIFSVHDMAPRSAAERRGQRPRLAAVATREVPGEDFPDDRTVVDPGPPVFDGSTLDMREVSGLIDVGVGADDDAPTVSLHVPDVGARDDDPDPLEADTVRHKPLRTPPPPISADVLAAHNPTPAHSLVRPPRRSRKTPAGGSPEVRPSLPLTAEDTPGPTVISALISDSIASAPTPTPTPAPAPAPAGSVPDDTQSTSPNDPSTVDRVNVAARARVSSQPPPLASDPFAFGSLAPGLDSEQLRALEVDAIPDAFKVGRGTLPRWVWRAGLAAVCVVAGIAIGLLFLDEAPPPASASIEIVSIPPGARIQLDGTAQPGTAPMVLRDAQPGGEYTIVAELAGYRRWERTEHIPEEGGPVKVIAALKPVVVTLHVESTPEGAEVFLNGRSVGRTPLSLPRLDPTTATVVEVRARGFRPERRELDWAERTEQRQQFTLTP